MVNLMLTFLYTGDYDYSSLEQPNVMPLMLQAKIYTLADKYWIPTLMRLAENKYKRVLATNSSLEDYFLSIPEVYILPTSAGQLRADTDNELCLSEDEEQRPPEYYLAESENLDVQRLRQRQYSPKTQDQLD
jgi:hypothetical protein